MHFLWDEHKERRNRRKHRVSFEAAALIFDDPAILSLPDRFVEGELRWLSIGLARGLVVLAVAHTVEEDQGEETIRIISARKASPHERREYERQGSKTQ